MLNVDAALIDQNRNSEDHNEQTMLTNRDLGSMLYPGAKLSKMNNSELVRSMIDWFQMSVFVMEPNTGLSTRNTIQTSPLPAIPMILIMLFKDNCNLLRAAPAPASVSLSAQETKFADDHSILLHKARAQSDASDTKAVLLSYLVAQMKNLTNRTRRVTQNKIGTPERLVHNQRRSLRTTDISAVCASSIRNK